MTTTRPLLEYGRLKIETIQTKTNDSRSKHCLR